MVAVAAVGWDLAQAEEMGKANVSFLSYFLLGKVEECLEVLIKVRPLPLGRDFMGCAAGMSACLHQMATSRGEEYDVMLLVVVVVVLPVARRSVCLKPLSWLGHTCRPRWAACWPCGRRTWAR